jgi:hypothetical protein
MLQTYDEQACGDLEEFRDKLSLFRFTLAPREQQMLDELLLQSMELADGKKLHAFRSTLSPSEQQLLDAVVLAACEPH